MKKGSKKPGKKTKVGRIREAFSTKKSYTVDELMKLSGFDERNLRTAMTILRNPKRTKILLETEYDREKKTFTVK